ncbi:hypothetical protein BDV28DRAFT_148955 [Aspergillus coremiiformis]|uniref:Major facilitator superfamily domain-containing protein n=1 Tax=Aspergillus coremiiformis TaxID=138285 RepID=A0A5N6Z6I4_9EURO|nr:hypothetical protein BDV28DRAFT_148955 [Aspergillus coremiiformis]
MPIIQNQQQDIQPFRIDRARLQVTLPCAYAGCLMAMAYGWGPTMAIAANNLVRYLLGARATALAEPLINQIGIGWTGMVIAGIWNAGSPLLWAMFHWGYDWRKNRR